MSRTETLVPMWIHKSGNQVLDKMPPRPVVIEVATLGAVLYGQVLELSMYGARIVPDDPFLLWSNVRVTVRFRFADTIYTLSGNTTVNDGERSFTFEFDSVTRKRMEVLSAQLKESGCMGAAEMGAAKKKSAKQEQEDEEAAEAERDEKRDAEEKKKKEMMQVRHLLGPEGEERRAHPRHELMVDATVQKITTSRIMRCQVLEISLGGCRIYTELPHGYQVGDQVEVQFVGGGFPFRLAASVQFELEGHVAGVKFLHMSMRTSERLVHLTEELAYQKMSALQVE